MRGGPARPARGVATFAAGERRQAGENPGGGARINRTKWPFLVSAIEPAFQFRCSRNLRFRPMESGGSHCEDEQPHKVTKGVTNGTCRLCVARFSARHVILTTLDGANGSPSPAEAVFPPGVVPDPEPAFRSLLARTSAKSTPPPRRTTVCHPAPKQPLPRRHFGQPTTTCPGPRTKASR